MPSEWIRGKGIATHEPLRLRVNLFGNVFVRRHGRVSDDKKKWSKISALSEAGNCYENLVDIHSPVLQTISGIESCVINLQF